MVLAVKGTTVSTRLFDFALSRGSIKGLTVVEILIRQTFLLKIATRSREGKCGRHLLVFVITGIMGSSFYAPCV